MNRTVWKYPLEPKHRQTFEMPEDAELLTIRMLGRVPAMYAEVNPDRPKTKRIFEFVGTGRAVPAGGKYVGSFEFEISDVGWGANHLVYHCYEVFNG